jgi:hypothetical protein
MDSTETRLFRSASLCLTLALAVSVGLSGDVYGYDSEQLEGADVPRIALQGFCPSGFVAKVGKNTSFPSDGKSREFHVLLPKSLDTPRQLFIVQTGTMAKEMDFVSDARSGFESLIENGWIVVVPFRTCTTERRSCKGIGPLGSNDGRFWEPWFDGALVQTDDEGPDVRFIESVVRCIASSYLVDRNRIYNGGISAGGTLTHRNMMFNSDLFAGGVSASGNYRYLGKLPIEPKSSIPMEESIVVLLWGGSEDKHGKTSFYDVETKLAAEYYARQSNVVTVACSGTHGHRWPPAFTSWAAQTVLSHPKGTPIADFELTTPPTGFSCVLGVYQDH